MSENAQAGALKFKQWQLRRKPSKYHNQRVTVNGNTFDSRKEADRYLFLLDRFAKGEIKSLVLQPCFKFPMGFSYYADFKYIEKDKVIVEDTKGFKTDVYRLKKKCFNYFYPKLELVEV